MEPGLCPLCRRQADELHSSDAAGGVCCEACHCDASAPASAAARRYRRPPSARRREPSPYERLFDAVYQLLKDAGIAVHGDEWGVFGLGDPDLPLVGWCPVCRAGTIAVRLLATDPPRARTEGCDAGCSPDLISDVIAEALA